MSLFVCRFALPSREEQDPESESKEEPRRSVDSCHCFMATVLDCTLPCSTFFNYR